MQAVQECCDIPRSQIGISLIQGPPGTGKTQVICGILACLLHGNKFRRGHIEEQPTAPNGQGLRKNSAPCKRVLVCAQSNAAIDELLGRLNMRGMAISTSKSRAAAMLRLGSLEAAHPAALQFHIDYVIDSHGTEGASEKNGGQPTMLAQLRAQLLETVQNLSNAKLERTGV